MIGLNTKGKGVLILLLAGISIAIFSQTFPVLAGNGAYSSQKSFNLDLASPSFRFEQNQFNDTSYNTSYTYTAAGNFSLWIELPKNSTIANASMNLTGIILVNATDIDDELHRIDIGNITNDQGNEIAISSHKVGGNNLRVYDRNNNFLWGYDVDDDVFDVEIGNVTTDSGNEVVIGSENFVSVLNSSGGLIWNNSIEVNSVSIGNLTSDSGNEVAVGGIYIYILNTSGSDVLNYSSISGINGIDIGEVVASSTGNEVAVGTGGTDDRVYLMNYTNGNLTEIWNYSFSDNINDVEIGNVTPDTGNEIVAVTGGGGTDNYVLVLNSTGDMVWNYSLGDVGLDVAIGEVVDSHNGNEVVAALGSGTDDRMYILNRTGQLILSYPGDNYIRGITIGNVTTDTGVNENEVLAVSAGGYIYRLDYDDFPTNVTIYIGGTEAWNYTQGDGRLRGSNIASGLEQEIQNFLDNDTLCPGDTCDVSIVIQSEIVGILNISDLNVTYDYNALPNINNVTIAPSWSRNVNVRANESIVSEAINISYSNPAIDIEIRYIKINDSATSCGLKNSTYSNVTISAANYCNVTDESIVVSSATGHAPTLLWDSGMDKAVPIFMHENATYNTSGPDNNYWRKNFTISSNASEQFTNIIANVTVNDSIILGDAFLNVTWGGTVYDITPSTTCPTLDSSLPLNFVGCSNDTDINGITDFFNFTQPNISAMGSVAYQAGGSRNLKPNLSVANVTPASGFWGDGFNFSVYVNNTDGDDVNVTLWFYFNLTDSWVNMGTESTSTSETVYFNLTSDMSWVGTGKFKFEYQDFNASGSPLHSAVNTTMVTKPVALKHNVTVNNTAGNNSVVYRKNETITGNESVLLIVRLNDTTDYDNWTATNCNVWVTTNSGSGYDSGQASQINQTGHCNMTFDPDGNYTVGQQIWNATIDETYYNMLNWMNFTVNVKGHLNVSITTPLENQNIGRNEQGMYVARLLDEYGSGVSLSGYDCTWYFNETNQIGLNVTNQTGQCNLTWTPNCSYQNLGAYKLNVTFNGSQPQYYAIYGNMTSMDVLLVDNTTINIDLPASGSMFNREASVSINSTVNDTCGTWNINPYNVTWYFSWMDKFNITFNETMGLNRTNEIVVINGSELSNSDVNLSAWKFNSTRIVCGGVSVPVRINTNASNDYMEAVSELIFLLNMSANQAKTCEFYFDTEDAFSNTSIYYIRNSGFEAGSGSSWQTSGQTEIVSSGNVSEGSYSYRVGNYSDSAAWINQTFYLSSSHIHISMRAHYKDEGTVVIAIDNGTVTVLEKFGDDSEEDANIDATDSGWIERNYDVSSFTGQSVTLVIAANASAWPTLDKSEVYVDSICLSDSNGNCTSYETGSRMPMDIDSKTVISTEQNSSWVIPYDHDAGIQTILAKMNGTYYRDSKNYSRIDIYGWSNVSYINFSAVVDGECVGTTCLASSDIMLYCIVLDANTSAGIYNHTVNFFDNGTAIGNTTTNRSGYAVFLWDNSTGTTGQHVIKCNISDSSKTYYNITRNNSMGMNLTLSSENATGNLTVTPAYIEAYNIKKNRNETVDFNITVNNTGINIMYGIRIFVFNKTNFTSSYSACTNLAASQTCNGTVSFDVSRLADLGNTSINVSLRWSNPDGAFENRTVTIDVKNTTILDITESAIAVSTPFGGSSSENITVEAFGNTPLNNVIMNVTGGDAATVGSWVSFSQEGFSVSKASTTSVQVTVDVPDNSSNMGSYTVFILANETGSGCGGAYDNCTGYAVLNITVNNQDWRVSPIDDDMIMAGVNTNNIGSFEAINITNLESQNLTINISLSYGTVNTTTGELIGNGNGSAFFNVTLLFNGSLTQLPSAVPLNITDLSSGIVNVTYNITNASMSDIGRYYINISIKNMNGSAVPGYFNLTRLLEISKLEVAILSPNSSSPMTNVGAGDTVEITANVTYNNQPLTENMSWYVEVGGAACTVLGSTNITGSLWNITCQAPQIAGNPINNTLMVRGNYTTQGIIFNATESNSIIYSDITPPQIWSIELWVNGSSSLVADNDPNIHYESENVTNITIRVNVTDNYNVSAVRITVTDPASSTTNINLTGSGNGIWEGNYTNPKTIGDYRINVYANDSNNLTNNTVGMTMGWFDIYRPIQFEGNFTDAVGAAFDANVTFYKPGTSWVIAENSSSDEYNLTIHDRSYDILAEFFNYSIRFRGANITASAIDQFNTSSPGNITDAFIFDNFADKNAVDISNIDLPNTAESILLAFAIEAPYLSYTDAVINVTYTYALAAGSFEEGDLRILYCSNWDFSLRACTGGEFEHFDELITPNVSANTFSFTANPGTAYAIAESCYPNNCGQSSPNGNGDYVPGGGLGGLPGGGDGDGGDGISSVCGNGACEVGENEINCPEDCEADYAQESMLEIRTTMTDVRLSPSQNKTHPLWITNRKNDSVSVVLSVDGSIQDFLSFEYDIINVSGNDTASSHVYVITSPDSSMGTYTGNIIARAGDVVEKLPVTLLISHIGDIGLDLIVEARTREVEQTGTLQFYIAMYNIGLKTEFDLNLTYVVTNIDTKANATIGGESLNIKTTRSFIKNVPLNAYNLSLGNYMIEVIADYEGGSTSSIDSFEVVMPFWTQDRIIMVVIAAVGIVAAVVGYYGWKRYKKWKMSRARYVFPVDQKNLPKESDKAFWIGKIAETKNKAFFDSRDLTTHALVAGATGSGKSVSASIFAEEALKMDIPVIVFDPTAQWTGFVRPCRDKNLLMYYPEFGMRREESKPFKGMIVEVKDPKLKINFKKLMKPGEITVFTLNKLKPGQYDEAVMHIIDTMFRIRWEESPELKMVVVFDEVHRLLEKYGGKGGYVALEKACREFRKWGIGLVMASQVSSDFKEAIMGNVLTEIQMNTKSLNDIKKISKKYGEIYASRITHEAVGVGMVQNPKYNKGKPYFINFRPTLHSPHKISEAEMLQYKKYSIIVAKIENEINKIKKAGTDVVELELELGLVKDKLKEGRFKMVGIYVNLLKKKLKI